MILLATVHDMKLQQREFVPLNSAAQRKKPFWHVYEGADVPAGPTWDVDDGASEAIFTNLNQIHRVPPSPPQIQTNLLDVGDGGAGCCIVD